MERTRNFLDTSPQNRLSSLPRSALVLTSAVISLSLGTMAHAQNIGVNSAIKNDVSIQSPDEDAARVAAVGGDVSLSDTIRSGDDSALQVLLLDETVFTVGPQAELVVDKFVYDPDAGTGEVAAAVARGAFRFMSGRTARKTGAVNIDTPVGSMGVRGTIVEGVIGNDQIAAILSGLPIFDGLTVPEDATLVVLRGPGEDQNGLNKDGVVDVRNNVDTVTLTKPASAALILGPDMPIIGPFSLTDAGSALLRDWLGSQPVGNEGVGLPTFSLPTGRELDFDDLIAVLDDLEEEQVIDRPTGDCGLSDGDGLPATGGGLILGGPGGNQTVGDYGIVICQ